MMIHNPSGAFPRYIAPHPVQKDDQNTSISHLSSLVCVDDVLGEGMPG